MGKPSKSDVSRVMSALSRKRKAKKGGRPKSEDRCPCGKYTAEYAQRRNHRC